MIKILRRAFLLGGGLDLLEEGELGSGLVELPDVELLVGLQALVDVTRGKALRLASKYEKNYQPNKIKHEKEEGRRRKAGGKERERKREI